MKRVIVMMTVAVLFFSFSTPSFALLRKDLEIAKGRVVAVDAAKNEMIITDYGTGLNKAYIVPAAVVGSLEKGKEVVVISKPGSNIARSVRLVIKRR